MSGTANAYAKQIAFLQVIMPEKPLDGIGYLVNHEAFRLINMIAFDTLINDFARFSYKCRRQFGAANINAAK
jgi:hypothetical protein